MNCKDIQAKLIDYLDQRLDAASAGEMQQHLATCAACSREAEELRELLATMSSGPVETPPAALRESFNMMLQSEINMQATTTIIEEFPPAKGEARSDAKIFHLSSPLWRVAAAVILLAGGIGIGLSIRTKPSVEATTTSNEIAAMR